jgi:nicotinamidase/pyrazinamidase
MATIFTRIIEGEIPAHRVYQDDHAYAFLDINPARPGHTLVVPRQEVPYLFDLDPEEHAALWAAVREVAVRLKRATGCERVVVVAYGADVPHAHVHLIPLEAGGSLPFPSAAPAAPADLVAMAELIRLASRPNYDHKTALLVVDVQNDFVDPRGSLYVPGAEQMIPVVNSEIARAKEAGATIVYTRDWHPPTTPHFARDGGTWPVHCVAETTGADFYPGLNVLPESVFTLKGTGGEDGYSAFSMRQPLDGSITATGLEDALRENHIARVVVVGFATDYCVKETALDAVCLGFGAEVLTDAVLAADLLPGDGAEALQAMAEQGVEIW